MTIAIGIDVGGTKVLGVVADESGSVLDECRAATPLDGGVHMVEAMARVAKELRARHPGAQSLGAGVAGLVTLDGVVRVSPNLPSVVELPVRALLEEAVGLPVRVDNAATCALW
ncbi:MAG TPA: ROK family protein, partial [Candidatus Limnocylindrales bacterium]